MDFKIEVLQIGKMHIQGQLIISNLEHPTKIFVVIVLEFIFYMSEFIPQQFKWPYFASLQMTKPLSIKEA